MLGANPRLTYCSLHVAWLFQTQPVQGRKTLCFHTVCIPKAHVLDSCVRALKGVGPLRDGGSWAVIDAQPSEGAAAHPGGWGQAL